MIRISTTALVVGDHVFTSGGMEGFVTWMPKHRQGRFWIEVDGTPISVRDCGTVELLSDLNGRIEAESFGRW
jgi:preprotein translocase subunit YajC